jgi:2-furoyl-CoA dehydrogenase large subunit
VGIGPVRGTFTAQARFLDLVAPRTMNLEVEASGPLGSSRGGGAVELVPEGDGTRVRYEYGVDLSGKIAAVGSRMIESASRVLIGAFFEALAQRAAPAGAASSPRHPSLWRRLLRLLGFGA